MSRATVAEFTCLTTLPDFCFISLLSTCAREIRFESASEVELINGGSSKVQVTRSALSSNPYTVGVVSPTPVTEFIRSGERIAAVKHLVGQRRQCRILVLIVIGTCPQNFEAARMVGYRDHLRPRFDHQNNMDR